MTDDCDPGAGCAWLRVRRLHPAGARLVRARANLDGEAPREALRYCGPFANANRVGFLLHSPVDVDITYNPDADEPWTFEWLDGGYPDSDLEILARLLPRLAGSVPAQVRPRTKAFASSGGYEPAHTVQLWTGCVFETPPGWGLWIRSPVNRGYDEPFRIQEGIVETDWLRADLYLNLRFTLTGLPATLRRSGPPLAQLVPVPLPLWSTETILDDRLVDPDRDEDRLLFQDWCDYDREKHFTSGDKDSDVYNRRRRERTRRHGHQADSGRPDLE